MDDQFLLRQFQWSSVVAKFVVTSINNECIAVSNEKKLCGEEFIINQNLASKAQNYKFALENWSILDLQFRVCNCLRLAGL